MPFEYDLTQLQSRSQLINFLGLDEKTFESILAFIPSEPDPTELSAEGIRFLEIPLFLQHRIPKKNIQRGYRVVWEPTFLKNEYKALASRLNSFLKFKLDGYPHDRTFGYIGGRNIRENAQDHCGRKNLLSIDLKDFFPSIKAERIQTLLESLGINGTVAELFSRFVTIEGGLPLGLPTSPTIANAVCLPMDVELDVFAKKHEASFSRYADDISFSSNGILPSTDELRDCVERHQFQIAESKTRRSRLGQAHYVTGLSVSDNFQPHVPRKKKRRLRQEFYYAEKYGLDDHFHHLGINDHRVIQQEVNRIDGFVKFAAYHEPRHSTRLKSVWAKILKESGNTPSFRPKNQHKAPFFIFVDEAEYKKPSGERVLALGMSVSQHQDQIASQTQEVWEKALADVWASGDREAIAKRGLHFSEITEDVRFTYVEKMRGFPFEGYVAMARLLDTSQYENTYIRLLGALIKRRLMAAESKFACLIFEKNDKVRQQSVRDVVSKAHVALCDANNRRPEACFVDFSGKPNPSMSVPDFMLGVLGKYLISGPEKAGKPISRDVLMFERIRDKYRLILDVDNWAEYGRRRPIAAW